MLYHGALAAGLGRRAATAVTATAAAIGVGHLAGLGPYRPLDITPSTEPLSLLALVATVAVPTAIALHVVALGRLRTGDRPEHDRADDTLPASG